MKPSRDDSLVSLDGEDDGRAVQRSLLVGDGDDRGRAETLHEVVVELDDVKREVEAGSSSSSNSSSERRVAKADAVPDSAPVSVVRLFAQAKQERGMLAVATVALFVSAAANLAIPNYVGEIIDALAHQDKDEGERLLEAAVYKLIAIVSVGALFSFVRGTLFSLAGERVVARLRRRLFSAIIAQEIAMFDVSSTGELVNRLSSDTTLLKSAVTANVSMGLRWVATLIGGVSYLFVISWKLTLVMLSVVPVISIGARQYGMYLRKLGKKTQDALADATKTAEESLSHIRTVRAFAKEDHQRGLYSDKIEVTYQLGRSVAFAYGTFIGVIGLAGSLGVVLVLYYGGRLVLDGEISAGTLTSFILYTLTVSVAFAGLSGLFGMIMKAIGANQRVFALIDREPSINLAGGKRPAEDNWTGLVEFDRVGFAYPSRMDAPVLRDFTLSFKPGSVTALVGQSGGGKSTVVRLLCRFYDPQQGAVRLDGHDLRDLDPKWLRTRMALVSQEPVLFATTIRENLSYGNPNGRPFTHDEIVAATRLANAHDFIMSFPDGYDTLVGERGVRLSTGQKQRVAIARAVLLDPEILLLDESTSALDAESEGVVQAALDRVMVGRTTIVIAHRLSTVISADNIVVIHGGSVVEQGTHAELLERNGAYAKLVEKQLS
eukprot:TRINITY_DN46478_c0_g1_i2.p1 TRINITY_DN46478_c0_g1~~TRINITY_DN46478_c0_g1_i2.p1  ORF type:complete len:661 (-),score=311.33 TRINITY_DN46478_c0_g1_i2:93-2075(-)